MITCIARVHSRVPELPAAPILCLTFDNLEQILTMKGNTFMAMFDRYAGLVVIVLSLEDVLLDDFKINVDELLLVVTPADLTLY